MTKSTTKTEHKYKHTNSLIHATSPYLLQHAHNPVNWHEWGEAALQEARDSDKPVFLSIGYAACHWCHVMEHECFENDEVARVLNEGFVSIKVDREERPDIDELYMAYTQATTGSGGWPMSVWISPDGVPFYAGTYFPRRSFLQLLSKIRSMWVNDREQLVGRSQEARDYLARWAQPPPPAEGVIPLDAVDRNARTLARYFDSDTGGMAGNGNKFPPSMAMDLMLRVYRRTGDPALWDAVDRTLDHMARGGIYDQVGGGICRYSTDPVWLVPHFEKMLYDQAMVSAVYLDAFQTSHKAEYGRVASDIFDYVIQDLQSPEGGFYSSRDADSDGMEGKFYIWTKQQINEALGNEEGALCCAFFDVTDRGNWFERRGHAPPGVKNILRVKVPRVAFAKAHGLTANELDRKIATWRTTLRAVRAKRVPPGLDDKVLCAWNGLMISSLAKGAQVLDKPVYAQAAARAATFILDHMRTEDGRLLRSYRNGRSHLTAYLDDYAFFVDGLINLYEATFDPRWLVEARALTDLSIKHYGDVEHGGFFYTADDSEKLLARSKSPRDGAIPSGNSVHAMNLLRLALLFDDKEYKSEAILLFRAFADDATRSPGAFERLNCAADFYHDRVKEIAIIGDPASRQTQALIRTVYQTYIPNKAVVFAPDLLEKTDIVLLRGKRRRGGKPTAYVCEHYECKEPVTTPEALAKLLAARANDKPSG